MPGRLTPQAMLELGRLRRRLRQMEIDLGISNVSPASPLMSRFGLDDVEHLVGEHPTSMVSIHSAAGDYLFVSPSCEALFGWSPEQLIGQTAYAFFHEDDLARIAVDHAAHGSDGGRERQIEYRLRCADGGYRKVETRSRALLGPEGIEQIICVTHPLAEH